MNHYTILFQLIVLIALSGCTYLHEAGKQAHYAAQLKNDPKLNIYKHFVNTRKFFVYGKIRWCPAQLLYLCTFLPFFPAIQDLEE